MEDHSGGKTFLLSAYISSYTDGSSPSIRQHAYRPGHILILEAGENASSNLIGLALVIPCSIYSKKLQVVIR